MSPLFRRTPYIIRQSRQITRALLEQLDAQYQNVIARLAVSTTQPGYVQSSVDSLCLLAEISSQVQRLAAQSDLESLPEVQAELRHLSHHIAEQLHSLAEEQLESRQTMLNTLQSLTVAQQKLQEAVQNVRVKSRAEANALPVLVPTDLLFQCWHSLLPAEKMIVVAGRLRANKIVLSASFNVTGSCSAGHVRADPQKLARALIAMSASDTHLAAWFHSHPGTGVACVEPSTTDLRQQRDWLQNYSPHLLSAIFVQDGFLRLWGSALEEKQIEIQFIGTGVEPEGESHVYHLNAS